MKYDSKNANKPLFGVGTPSLDLTIHISNKVPDENIAVNMAFGCQTSPCRNKLKTTDQHIKILKMRIWGPVTYKTC